MARPPRLKSISIQDYRGFPGQANPPIELNGRNLLVYGENGSGKSTIYKALDSFFSAEFRNKSARANALRDAGHIFTDEAMRSPSVEVKFTDDVVRRWDANRHPNDPTADGRVFAASYRKGMLDYRSLLDLSYRYLGSKLDLFPACVSVLLRDLQIAHQGSERPFFRLWRETQDEFKLYHFQSRIDGINERLGSINAGLNLALPRIIAETDTLLKEMLHGELELTDLEFTGLAFRWVQHRPSRKITGQAIIPEVKLRGAPLVSPHTFLNEARVSALAIALYLAGRKICGETLQPDTPKILVLDDLLVGLDQSNRLPVLKMLTRHFSRWQIILLTHDRVWFEMARANLSTSGNNAWNAMEMYEGKGPSGYTHPVQRPLKRFDVIAGNIERSRAFLADNFDNAAAVHTRIAFEQSLKQFCDQWGVRVPFKSDPKHLNTGDLLDSIKAWLGEPRRAAGKAILSPHIRAVEAARRVVLNPFAHSTPVTLARAEITTAIDAVETLDAKFKEAFPR
jgi:energy-coupling factor transporter ATP-binding protein EcfA2